MRVQAIEPPRRFVVGKTNVSICDCAHIELEADEQVTFKTARGGELDVTRKLWGFYATPSLDARLPRFGLRPALVRNHLGRHFVLLCESDFEEQFGSYLVDEELTLVVWLDDQDALQRIAAMFTGVCL